MARAETLRGYHRHPETKFLHGEATDSGATQRRHVLVEAIEDIGKEADKWDDEDPIGVEDEFTVAEQVDLAEKTFHDALAHRNEAQIAYLREPSIITHVALEAAKTAETVALEILDTEVRWLASTRATTVIGLKLKASYASTEGKLANSSERCGGRWRVLPWRLWRGWTVTNAHSAKPRHLTVIPH